MHPLARRARLLIRQARRSHPLAHRILPRKPLMGSRSHLIRSSRPRYFSSWRSGASTVWPSWRNTSDVTARNPTHRRPPPRSRPPHCQTTRCWHRQTSALRTDLLNPMTARPLRHLGHAAPPGRKVDDDNCGTAGGEDGKDRKAAHQDRTRWRFGLVGLARACSIHSLALRAHRDELHALARSHSLAGASGS
jgi:hypothetical protein